MPRRSRGADEIYPIYCCIRMKGYEKPTKFSTNLCAKWDTAKRRAVGKNGPAVNVELERIKAELFQIRFELERTQVDYTPTLVYEKYCNRYQKTWRWLEAFDEYGTLVEAKILSKELSNGEVRKWTKHRNHLVVFLRHLNKKDCGLQDIQRGWFEQAKTFFLGKKNKQGGLLSWNYVRNIIHYFHRVILFGKDNGYLLIDPWSGLSMPEKEMDGSDFVYLNATERKQLYEYVPTSKKMEQIKDMALFMMHSGLGHGDYEALSDELVAENDGDWLMGERGKTGTNFFVPVWKFPVLGELIAKYDRNLKKLPRLSNTNYNLQIKAMLLDAGIDKPNFTTHDCRRTFAMLCYEQYAISDELVAEFVGHKHTSITHKHYIRTTVERVRQKLS